MRRRSVLLGLGTAAAGSGIAFGSGAFTQVQASRDISIGVSTDENALVELKANPEIQSVFQNTEGELAVDTSRLSSDDKGFNVGSTVQIGATTESFGDTVDVSNPAFEIINRFDDSSGNSSEFDGTIDIGVDLTAIVPDDEDQINALEFIASKSGNDDGDAESSEVVKAGDRKVLTGLEPAGSDGDDDRVAVAIRVETSNTSGEFSVDDAIVIQAGSDLTAGDFPNERAAPAGTVENQNTGATFSDITTAVNDANTDDTLIVGPGTYDESVTIDTEGLTLEAADGATPTIDAESDDNAISVSVVDPDDSDAEVTISGFEFAGFSERAIVAGYEGANADAPSDVPVRISGNHVPSNGNDPRGAFTVGADGSSISGNEVTGGSLDDPEWQGFAIAVDGAKNVSVTGNEVTGAPDSVGIGVTSFFDDVENIDIKNNEIEADSAIQIYEESGSIDTETIDISDNSLSSDGLFVEAYGLLSNDELKAILNDQGNTFDPAGTVEGNQIVPENGN